MITMQQIVAMQPLALRTTAIAGPRTSTQAPRPRFMRSTRDSVRVRGIGDDVAAGFFDVAKLVSGTNFSKKTPYDSLASKIGDVCHADMQGWRIFFRDMKATPGGDVTMAQLLASQIGPMMTRDGVDERDVESIMKKIPVSFGKQKVTLSLLDVTPNGCVRDLMRALEDAARDL